MSKALDFDCIFRPAMETDVEALHRLITEGWMDTYGPHVSELSRRRFASEDAVGNYLNLFLDGMQVAVIDGQVVGVVNEFCGFVGALFVVKPFRGNRIGSALLHNAMIAGGSRLEVAEFNHRAIQLYERMGWVKDHSYQEDVFGSYLLTWVMTRG